MSLFFLAFLTFWISTWMVTDIHEGSIDEQPHPIFSIDAQPHSTRHQHLQTIEEKTHQTHCNICSDDHGGHMGKSLGAILFSSERAPIQSVLTSPPSNNFWYSQAITPKVRPPIT